MYQLDLSQFHSREEQEGAQPGGARNAILIIHGIGEQHPLQTLDQFARGLRLALNAEHFPEGEDAYRVIHRQVTYLTPKAQEPWLENYIALEAGDDKPKFDIYEFYWAHHMTGQASISDIKSWVGEVSRYARRYYRKRAAQWSAEEMSRFALRRKEDPTLRNLFEPNGQFHHNGYLRNFGWMLRAALAIYELLKDSALRNWPFIRMLYNFVSRKLNELLVNYVGDVVVYTTMDRKARHYEVRREILRSGRLEVEALLKNGAYQSILIAGHSLGSVIAYDIVNRLHTMPILGSDAEQWKQALTRVRGLITFGSPLDKIAFFFRQQVAKNAHIRRHMLNHLHSFKKQTLDDPDIDPGAPDYVAVSNEVENKLTHVRWINFFDKDDPVSGCLDLYRVDENKQYHMGAAYGVAHLAYWDFQPMYRDILRFFAEELQP